MLLQFSARPTDAVIIAYRSHWVSAFGVRPGTIFGEHSGNSVHGAEEGFNRNSLVSDFSRSIRYGLGEAQRITAEPELIVALTISKASAPASVTRSPDAVTLSPLQLSTTHLPL